MTRQHRNISNNAIRGALYGIVVVPTLLGLIINYTSNQLPFIKFVYWLIALVSASFLVELLIAYKKSSSKYIFSASQIRLTTELDSLIPLIKKSNDIAILCDTLKSFIDDESRLKSLLKRIDENCTLRILVLNPKCDGQSEFHAGVYYWLEKSKLLNSDLNAVKTVKVNNNF